MQNKPRLYSFFAVKEDLQAILEIAEAEQSLRYVQIGLFDDADCAVFDSFRKIPQFGIAEFGDVNFEPTFLILREREDLKVRAVGQRTGGTKYAVDQLQNPASIVLRPGGCIAMLR